LSAQALQTTVPTGRIYATNAPQAGLTLAQAVWAYRSQYLAENIFRRLQGKLLSITPLADYTAKEALAQEHEQLSSIFSDNPLRGTITPITDRMLRLPLFYLLVLTLPNLAFAQFFVSHMGFIHVANFKTRLVGVIKLNGETVSAGQRLAQNRGDARRRA
jgi:hypothetical protein